MLVPAGNLCWRIVVLETRQLEKQGMFRLGIRSFTQYNTTRRRKPLGVVNR
jgi:hypothetical protein